MFVGYNVLKLGSVDGTLHGALAPGLRVVYGTLSHSSIPIPRRHAIAPTPAQLTQFSLYPSATSNHARTPMEERGEKDSPPLQIDPKWYVGGQAIAWIADR